MPRKRTPPGTGPSHLSEEDRLVWEHTARTLEPIYRGRRLSKRAPAAAAPSSALPSPASAPFTAERWPRGRAAASTPAPAPPPFAEIDRRQARKLGAGRVSIDARVDLHGMTRPEAHAALRDFLLRARDSEARWVLVITGKGAPRRSTSSILDDAVMPREGGVLRREVPRWLKEPDLNAIVIGFRPAARAHGGDGALYIQLRQRRSGKGRSPLSP